jgi:uracil-DNA glycosylase
LILFIFYLFFFLHLHKKSISSPKTKTSDRRMSLLKFFKGDTTSSEKKSEPAKRKASSSSSSSASPSKKQRVGALSLDTITDDGWKSILASEEKKNYFKSLRTFVDSAYSSKKIYPARDDIFAAFNLTPWDNVRVVVIGQDPYHGAGQAHGLAFSVRRGHAVPPSLRNIYKELMNDADVPTFNKQKPEHGYLTQWSRQGVFMLNTVLTVQAATPYSHRKKGWETFTKAALTKLAREREGLVFLCWGAGAHKLADECGVSSKKHLIIKTSHPSPLGATKTKSPFIGSKCFSKCNTYLEEHGKQPIEWRIDNKEGL